MTRLPIVHRFRIAGFNLLEMMVTVSIFGIASAIALPALGNMLEKNRVQTASADLVSAMNIARTEAMRRNAPVQIQANGSWNQGWCVRVRELHSLYSDETLCQKDANLIASFAAPDSAISIAGPGSSVTYFANGSLFSGSSAKPVNLRVCKADGSGTQVSVALAGTVHSNRIPSGC